MKISVVIPAYKAARFIRATLDSVAAQTRRPDELVVADDGSPDDTAGVVSAWAAGAPFPVRVVRMRRNSGGPSGPLNAGIRAATGDLVATLDHDDLMVPEKLEVQAAACRARPELGLVFHPCALAPDEVGADGAAQEYLDGVAAAVGRLAPGDGDGVRAVGRVAAHSELLGLNYSVTCSSMMFPRRVWRRVGGFDRRFRIACDYAFLQRVTRRYDIGYLPRPLVRWRRHGGTLTAADGVRRYDTELWRVLTGFDPRALTPGAAAALPGRVAAQAERLRELAYHSRQQGSHARAAGLYWLLLRHRPRPRYLADLAKVLLKSVGAAGRPAA